MLRRIDQFDRVPAECQGSVVSIGNFDGVHRGHLELVAGMRRMAQSLGAPAVVFTFDPHPVSLLRPEQPPAPLTWTERKAELLHASGVDEVVVVHTGPELLRLTPDEFFVRVVRGSLQARALVEGPNFGFGRNRAGSIATLNRLCTRDRIHLEIVDPIELEGQVVSSSRVRQGLAAGQVELAARLLGRPHRLRGRVGAGASRGAALGFPTANLFDCDVAVPADGVYAGRATVGGKTWAVAANIGPNPTFGDVEQKIEAHLIGFIGSLAGQSLEIDLIARLRDTRRFGSPAELVDQLKADVARAAAIAGV